MKTSGVAEAAKLAADIVVIGGGGAGLAAARAAAEKGASVIVLEKRGLGGASAMAFGIFAAESPVQKRKNIDCRRDDCFREAMEFAHWRINPRIVRAVIDKSADTIRWLEEIGLEFDCIPYLQLPDQKAPTWHVPTRGGAEIIRCLARTCRDLKVKLLIRTPAKRILKSAEGKITGVLAEAKGEEFIVRTNCVIVASGGFGGNKELLKKYCPEYHDNMRCCGLLHMTGDGLAMATELGAARDGLGHLMLVGPLTLGKLSLTIGAPPGTRQLPISLTTLLARETVWVNKLGKRFLDESQVRDHHVCAHAVARQPEAFCYTIFDAQVAEIMASKEELEERLVGFHGGPRRLSGAEAQLNEDIVFQANSWAEIADWIGAPPETLEATINEYNAACDNGYDPTFLKGPPYLVPLRTPPYYVVRWYPTFLNTAGGIKINEDFAVANNQDAPISGLYAAGVDTGGWVSETYNIRLSGWAFGYAVNSGRIAGEKAADFVRRQ